MYEKRDIDEKITEIRSSFRKLKEKDKRRYRNADIIGIVIIVSILFSIVISPYWDNTEIPSSVAKKKIETKSTNSNNKSLNVISTTNISNVSKKDIVEKTGISLIDKGFEVSVKSISSTRLYTNVWISIKNIENKEKLPFKISDSMIIDDVGNRYENVDMTGIQILQTNLSANATVEGSIFFERLKEGRYPDKLILKINRENFEFTLNRSNI